MYVAQAGVPTGTYETYFFGYNYSLEKWLGGDIEILPGGAYRFQNENGTFRQSGGDVIWDSGPLKGVVARYKLDSGGKPAIVIPRAENEARGNKMAVSDIWAYLR